MKNLIKLSSVAVTIGLAGCVSVLPDPKPADIIYRLDSNIAPVTPDNSAKVFRIDRATTPTFLQGDAIIVSPDGSTYQTAGQAKWSEAVPTLLQLSLLDALSSEADMIGILPTTGARTTYRVNLTVRNFEARFDQGEDSPPQAIVHYVATVADASSRNLLGTYTVKKSQRASSINVSSIVDAKRSANQMALTDIVAWMRSLDLQS